MEQNVVSRGQKLPAASRVTICPFPNSSDEPGVVMNHSRVGELGQYFTFCLILKLPKNPRDRETGRTPILKMETLRLSDLLEATQHGGQTEARAELSHVPPLGTSLRTLEPRGQDETFWTFFLASPPPL